MLPQGRAPIPPHALRQGSLGELDEQAVALFLEEAIAYLDIARVIEGVCDRHRDHNNSSPSLDDILAADVWARQAVIEASQSLGKRPVLIV